MPIPRDCSQPTDEKCNAFDDDCDGVIDDGCGYGTGFMQVTAAWDTGADIDLYVTGPLGDTLSFQRPSTPAGARMDHVRSGGLQRRSWKTRASRTFDGSASVPSRASTRWRFSIGGSAASAEGGPTNVTVSVAVAREIAGQYRHSLLPGERVRVVRFVVQ